MFKDKNLSFKLFSNFEGEGTASQSITSPFTTNIKDDSLCVTFNIIILIKMISLFPFEVGSWVGVIQTLIEPFGFSYFIIWT